MNNKIFVLLFALVALSSAGAASASPIMFVHDSSGNLATVDVDTGDVNLIGNMGVVLTDIAFDPNGTLYGVSFSQLYLVDPTTGDTTFIGNLGAGGMNALVFGADGTLYAASNSSTNLYTVNTATGAATSLGSMGAFSAGDLAFNGGELYLANTAGQLWHVDLSNLSASSNVGSFGISSVFGLATGDDGLLYGVAGTTIFTVDVLTGAGSGIVSYAGQGLFTAYGESFFSEAGATESVESADVTESTDNVEITPEPATLALLGSGLAIAGARVRRRRVA